MELFVLVLFVVLLIAGYVFFKKVMTSDHSASASCGGCCSTLSFSGWINPSEQGGTLPTYYTFGSGISSQEASAPPVGQTTNYGTAPLILPIQLSSSNPPTASYNVTSPSNIYLRIPGSGPKRLSGLRYSLEYATADNFTFKDVPAIIGVWMGRGVDGFTSPQIRQTALVDNFMLRDSRAATSRMQQGSNMRDEVMVNGGDYVALVVELPGGATPENGAIFVTASVELCGATSSQPSPSSVAIVNGRGALKRGEAVGMSGGGVPTNESVGMSGGAVGGSTGLLTARAVEMNSGKKVSKERSATRHKIEHPSSVDRINDEESRVASAMQCQRPVPSYCSRCH